MALATVLRPWAAADWVPGLRAVWPQAWPWAPAWLRARSWHITFWTAVGATGASYPPPRPQSPAPATVTWAVPTSARMILAPPGTTAADSVAVAVAADTIGASRSRGGRGGGRDSSFG